MILLKRKKIWGKNYCFKGIIRTFNEHVKPNRLCFSNKLNTSGHKIIPRKTGTNQNVWKFLLLLF